MKRYNIFILFLIYLAISLNLFAQDTEELFSNFSKSDIHQNLKDKLSKVVNKPLVKSFEILKINENKIKEMEFLSLNVPNFGKVVFNKEYTQLHESGAISFYGKSGINSVFLTVLDKYCFGTIILDNHKFKIEPLDNGFHVISELNELEFLKYENGPQRIINNPLSENIPLPINKVSTTTPNIKVLVAYTEEFLEYHGSTYIVNVFINDVEAETELTYYNSGIDTDLQIVHKVCISQPENDNFEQTLTDFSSRTDIQQLRDEYGADICVLLAVNCGATNGIADIPATSSGDPDVAFCLVKSDAAISNYSFAHEIGHLNGCRHDTNNEQLPFSYGHGFKFNFIYSPYIGSYRTVMAVHNEFPTRIPYWSNPNIYFPNSTDPNKKAMGSEDFANNKRVMNEMENTLGNYRTGKPASLIMSGSNGQHPTLSWTPNEESNIISYKIYRNSSYIGEVSSSTSTYTDYDIIISSGSSWNYIYYVKAYGANNLSGASNSVSTNGIPAKDAITEDPLFSFSLSNNYPNPFNPTTTIYYEIPSPCNVYLTVYDGLGRVVSNLVNEFKTEGRYSSVFNGQASGIYYYTLRAGGNFSVKKMTLIK